MSDNIKELDERRKELFELEKETTKERHKDMDLADTIKHRLSSSGAFFCHCCGNDNEPGPNTDMDVAVLITDAIGEHRNDHPD